MEIFDFDPPLRAVSLDEANALLARLHAHVRAVEVLNDEANYEWRLWRARAWALFDLTPEGKARINALTMLVKRTTKPVDCNGFQYGTGGKRNLKKCTECGAVTGHFGTHRRETYGAQD